MLSLFYVNLYIAASFLLKPLVLERMQLFTNFFKSFILNQFSYQILFSICFIIASISFIPWQQHFSLNTHKGSRHKYKFAGYLHIKFSHLMYIAQKIISDTGNRNFI